MTRSEIAAKLGIKISAVRYYETCGILSNVARDNNGYRNYSDDDVIRLGFVLKAKESGLTLSEIKKLLNNIALKEHSKEEAMAYVDALAMDVEIRIQKLQMAKAALGKVKDNIATGTCPYIKKLF